MRIKTSDGEVNVTPQGQGTLALVLGAVGTLGTLMSGGNLLGLGGGNNNRPQPAEGDRPVTRYEMNLWQQINEEKTKNALLAAKGYTDKAMFDVQAQFGQQGAWNAAQQVNINMLRHQLGDITKFVVPITSIDPVPTTGTTTQTTQTTQQQGGGR